MTEIEFWTKYCRAEYLFRTKNAATAAAEAADDEDLAVFTKDDDIIAMEARQKVNKKNKGRPPSRHELLSSAIKVSALEVICQ